MKPSYIPQIRLYQDWLARERGLRFASYDALWRWSVTDLDAFWQSIWDYFALQSPTPHEAVLADARMPGARWFPGAQVNYAHQVLRHVEAADAAGQPAVIARDERGRHVELSWAELRRQVASLALHLKAQGLQPGDRVAAYLPNTPEAMVAFLAVVSLGGIWSICAPDMGTAAVLDRFRQIEPKMLIACDGVVYGGRAHDRRAVVGELAAALPSVRHLVLWRSLDPACAIETIAQQQDFVRATGRNDDEVRAFSPLWLPFDHPLWIVYSSGTTGLPKPIVHGHGGTVLVALALKTLHNDVGCSYAPNSFGERYHWYSSTGWVMWNAQLSGLLNGTTCVIFDGNPGGRKEAPDWGTLWRFADETGVTFFGAGAAFYANCLKAGVDLTAWPGLARVRALGSTGSPLSEEAQRWGSAQFERLYAMAVHGGSEPHAVGERGGQQESSARPAGSPAPAGPGPGASAPPGGSEPHAVGERGGRQESSARPAGSPAPAGPGPGASAPRGGSEPHAVGERGGQQVWWCNISGGTDFAGAFIGGHRELPQTPGRMQCRLMGCAVEAWDEQGQPVIDQVGELVCTRPIPSMPLFFWGDEGHRRYLSSYFDMYPGVWRHGDWLRVLPDGSCVIYGRSDATINRHGLRMGTSEIYAAVEALPEVLDSMVVDLEYLGRPSWMPLFVVLREGLTLDDALRERIAAAIRTALSPRFVPDAIFQVAEIPRTLSGKKQELPVKKLLLGQPVEKVVNKDAMANPASLDWFVALARERQATG